MSESGAPPTLNLAELLTWHRENTWFSFHGKAVRSRVSERSARQLKPVFDLLKEPSTETISLEQLSDILKVSGQAITQQSFQQMLKGVTGSIQHGLSYPQFVQLITRDHVVKVEPQDGHGSPRPVRLCHDNKEVILRAYCRKQMLEGVMANENNWRARAEGMQQGWASRDTSAARTRPKHKARFSAGTVQASASAASHERPGSGATSSSDGSARPANESASPAVSPARPSGAEPGPAAETADLHAHGVTGAGSAGTAGSQSSENAAVSTVGALATDPLEAQHRKARHRLVANLGPVSERLQDILQAYLESRGATPDQASATLARTAASHPIRSTAGCAMRPDKTVCAQQRTKLEATQRVIAAASVC